MPSNGSRELRVFFPPYFPAASNECTRFPTMKVSPHCMFPGMIIEILNLISKETGIRIVPLTDYSFGIHQLGTIPLSELERMILNGTIDLVGFGLQKTVRRVREFEFSEWIYEAETMLVTRKREETLTSIWSFFHTYDRAIWLLIVGAVALQWLVCVFSRFVRRVKLRAGDCAFGCVRLLLLQPTSAAIGGTSAEHVSLCIFAIFCCTMLLGVFNSFILAKLIRDKWEPVDVFRVMIAGYASGEHRMVTNDPGKWFFEMINSSSQTYPFPELRAAMSKNPVRYVSTREEALRLVVEENAHFFQQSDEKSYYASKHWCNITTHRLPAVHSYFMFRPNHPLGSEVNETILNNRLKFIKIAAKYFKRARWEEDCDGDPAFRPLQLAPYTGLLYVCFFFVLAAVLVFLIEVLLQKRREFESKSNRPLVSKDS